MPEPDPKYPGNPNTYHTEPITTEQLPTGVRFDLAHRRRLLEELDAAGHLAFARDAFPPPTPTPLPVTILYPFLLLAFPAWSYGLQGRGDCMAWSATHCVDVLMAINITLLKKPEKAIALSSIEAQYGFMRVEVFGGKPDYGGDGASPSAAAQSVLRCGTLHQLLYLGGDHDLRQYDQSGGRSGQWGRYGVPDDLEPIAREHFTNDIALVEDFDTAVQLLGSGTPISNAHPQNPIYTTRDESGFGAKKWHGSHAMNYIGYRLGRRPGLLKINSGHGNHITGPMSPGDCPRVISACAAWEDADVADKVLQAQWSWAYSNYIGFPQKSLFSDRLADHQTHPNQIAT